MHIVAKLESLIFATGGPEPLSNSQLEAMGTAFSKPRSRAQMRDLCDRIEGLMNRLGDFLEFVNVVLEQIEFLFGKVQFKTETSGDDPARKAQNLLGRSSGFGDVNHASKQEEQPGAMSLLALRAGS